MSEVDALRREFEDFRREEREARKSLEQKLWGMIAATFLLVVGFLFSQYQQAAQPMTPGAGIGWILQWIT